MQADIGLIGLGVMGANLALNIAENGYHIAVHNRTASRIDEFVAEAGALAPNVSGHADLAEFVGALKAPRMVIIMVKAGKPVDAVITSLLPHLDKGDIILECGNAHYGDTERRAKELAPQGIGLLGVGVSGGEEGARHGPSIMVGGTKADWKRAKPILVAISAKYRGQPCCGYLGTGGAGHFVKMIHNGIEYADMQMIAEVYGVMRDGLGMAASECAPMFEEWNKGPLNSYLIEITSHVLRAVDDETGKPLVDLIVDRAGQKGTGRWSAIVAQELGVPATTIEAAVAARSLSASKNGRIAAQAIYGMPGASASAISIDMLEQALLAGKIAAYAQGFAVMTEASEQHGWDLPLGLVARIWRAGCIIRSRFLGEMAKAFDGDAPDNLLVAPEFVSIMKENHGALRQVAAAGALGGFPLICLGAALGYFDAYRQGRGTANLIQGQRDFFGAHGFVIEGRGEDLHYDWPEIIED